MVIDKILMYYYGVMLQGALRYQQVPVKTKMADSAITSFIGGINVIIT